MPLKTKSIYYISSRDLNKKISWVIADQIENLEVFFIILILPIVVSLKK